jgi:hypothetical protein
LRMPAASASDIPRREFVSLIMAMIGLKLNEI